MIRRVIFISLIATGLFSTAVSSYQDVSADTLNSWISQSENLYLLDVQEQYEYILRHIPGAVLFPWNSGVLLERYEKLPLDKQIIVICASGFRSAAAAAFLDTVQGGIFFEKIYRLESGMAGWTYEVVENDTELFPRQKVLAELFTASWCDSCFAVSRNLVEIVGPQVVQDSIFSLISYYVNDVGMPDPLIRTSYYQAEEIPVLFLNGAQEIDPYDLDATRIETAAADSSTLFLELQSGPPEDNGAVTVKVTVSACALVEDDEYGFFLVLTEKGIDPTEWTPPHYPSNGETVYNQAMRLMITGESGMPFTIQPGEVLLFDNSFTAESSWDLTNCEMVAFIQHPETQLILQAESRSFAELNIVEPDSSLEITCDFNLVGRINITDVIALLLFQRANPDDPRGDFNRNGKAGITDAVAMLLAQRNGACR